MDKISQWNGLVCRTSALGLIALSLKMSWKFGFSVSLLGSSALNEQCGEQAGNVRRYWYYSRMQELYWWWYRSVMATPGTRAEFGARARPRKRVNGKSNSRNFTGQYMALLLSILFFCVTPEGLKTFFFLLCIDIFKGKRNICGPEDFLFFADICSGKLLVGARKNLAIDFSRFWQADQKKIAHP